MKKAHRGGLFIEGGRSELVANAQAHSFDIGAIFFVPLHPVQTAINRFGNFHARTHSVGERGTTGIGVESRRSWDRKAAVFADCGCWGRR